MAKPTQATESAQLASSARDHLTSQPTSPTCAGGPTRHPILSGPRKQHARPSTPFPFFLHWPSQRQEPNRAPLSPCQAMAQPAPPAHSPLLPSGPLARAWSAWPNRRSSPAYPSLLPLAYPASTLAQPGHCHCMAQPGQQPKPLGS